MHYLSASRHPRDALDVRGGRTSQADLPGLRRGDAHAHAAHAGARRSTAERLPALRGSGRLISCQVAACCFVPLLELPGDRFRYDLLDYSGLHLKSRKGCEQRIDCFFNVWSKRRLWRDQRYYRVGRHLVLRAPIVRA